MMLANLALYLVKPQIKVLAKNLVICNVEIINIHVILNNPFISFRDNLITKCYWWENRFLFKIASYLDNKLHGKFYYWYGNGKCNFVIYNNGKLC